MIKLGVNSVLFGGYDLATAAQHIKAAGYDGIELSAIKGMCEHLVLDDWQSQADDIKRIVGDAGLQLLSMEVASLDPERLEKAFAAGAAIGVPIINVGPGGKMNVDEDLERQTDLLIAMSERAAAHGVTLCCKAHVGNCVYNTPTTLRAMEKVKSAAFGVDMDPSHIHRAGEDPAPALAAVLSRVRHVHIRDCKGRGPTPGVPAMQACGRGDIDLFAYFRTMVNGAYDGPVVLEVIGAKDHSLPAVCSIASESYGYMNAILRQLGAR